MLSGVAMRTSLTSRATGGDAEDGTFLTQPAFRAKAEWACVGGAYEDATDRISEGWRWDDARAGRAKPSGHTRTNLAFDILASKIGDAKSDPSVSTEVWLDLETNVCCCDLFNMYSGSPYILATLQSD